MGSQVVEIVVWLLSFGVCSILLGTMFQVIRGWLHGRIDKWADGNDYSDDKDVAEFLNAPSNNQEPWEMGDEHKHHNGLSYDKDGGLKSFMRRDNNNSDNNDDGKKK